MLRVPLLFQEQEAQQHAGCFNGCLRTAHLSTSSSSSFNDTSGSTFGTSSSSSFKFSSSGSFPGRRNGRRKNTWQSRNKYSSTRCLDYEYPMYVMSVEDLLKLDRLQPHQEMLEKGLVVEWEPWMSGRTIFVSHEWLGWVHPDPNSEQLSVLQRVLTRLMSGEVSKVESSTEQQMTYKQNTVVTGDSWKGALPHMFVWFDFLAIPQMCIHEDDEEEDNDEEEEEEEERTIQGDDPDHVLDAEKENLPFASSYSVASADLSEAKRQTSRDLKAAVNSIPAYIERTTLLLILVPICMHVDRHEPCCFATWRRRGWCRLELQAAHLKCGTLEIMVCTGPEATPYFFFPSSVYQLLCGPADFTCCQRDHYINGTRIECDKPKVNKVLTQMLTNQETYLKSSQQLDRQRWVSSLSQWVLTGLHVDDEGNSPSTEEEELGILKLPSLSWTGGSQDAPSCLALEALRKRLDWQAQDDTETERTGGTLLFYAALANDSAAVHSLLQCQGAGDINTAMKNPNLAKGEHPFTPLMAAMSFGDSKVVIQLLDARADPEQRMVGTGLDALMSAAYFCRRDNIKAWFQYFGGNWPSDRVDVLGYSALNIAAMLGADNGADVMQVLLATKADPCDHVLHSAASNPNSALGMVRLLVEARADVNQRSVPSTFKLRGALLFARWSVRLGAKSDILIKMASHGGSTPLMLAGQESKVAEVRKLLAAAADPKLQNDEGLTALELVRRKFGGEVPPLLQELLDTDSLCGLKSSWSLHQLSSWS